MKYSTRMLKKKLVQYNPAGILRKVLLSALEHYLNRA